MINVTFVGQAKSNRRVDKASYLREAVLLPQQELTMHTDSSSETPKFQTVSREAFWQRHVEQWRNSGLSKMAYCQQYALTYHQMVFWSKKDEDSIGPVAGSGGFVAVTVSTNARDSGLSLRLPNGITLEGINDRSIELVGKLIGQL